MSRKKKKATGPERMKQLDYVQVKVWFKREEKNRVVKSAERWGESLSGFVRKAAVRQAALDPRAEEKD